MTVKAVLRNGDFAAVHPPKERDFLLSIRE
jgi:hypothetical protein